jgi:hypothetical protein
MIAMKSGGLKGKERRKIETKSPLTPIFFGKKKKQPSPIFSNMVTSINIITTTLNTFISTISLSNNREPKNQSL